MFLGACNVMYHDPFMPGLDSSTASEFDISSSLNISGMSDAYLSDASISQYFENPRCSTPNYPYACIQSTNMLHYTNLPVNATTPQDINELGSNLSQSALVPDMHQNAVSPKVPDPSECVREQYISDYAVNSFTQYNSVIPDSSQYSGQPAPTHCAVRPDMSYYPVNYNKTPYGEVSQPPVYTELSQYTAQVMVSQSPVYTELSQYTAQSPVYTDLSQPTAQSPVYTELSQSTAQDTVSPSPVYTELSQSTAQDKVSQFPVYTELSQPTAQDKVSQSLVYTELSQPTAQSPVYAELSQSTAQDTVSQSPGHAELSQHTAHDEVSQSTEDNILAASTAPQDKVNIEMTELLADSAVPEPAFEIQVSQSTNETSPCHDNAFVETEDNDIGTDEVEAIRVPGLIKKKANPQQWKHNLRKSLRNSGQAYINIRGKWVPARKPKNTQCKCTFSCGEFSVEDRRNICNSYWKLLRNNTKRTEFILSHTEELPCKTHSADETKSLREKRRIYKLPTAEGVKRVCGKFFLATLCISKATVDYAYKRKIQYFPIAKTDQRGRKCDKRGKNAIKDEARRHILSYPSVQSHYVRKTSPNGI